MGQVIWQSFCAYFIYRFFKRVAHVFEDQHHVELEFSATIVALALIGSILVHELGHALVMWFFGYKVVSFGFLPFGAYVVADREYTPLVAICVSFAGPLCNLFLCLFLMSNEVYLPNTRSFVARVNYLLFLFNLFPGSILDGGNIARNTVKLTMGEGWANSQICSFVLLFILIKSFSIGWSTILEHPFKPWKLAE